MPRSYTLKRRAEAQAETRQRIVDAAIELHGTLGPAHTTISMIAQKAGVQRHTLYAHFADERAMLMACSGHSLERDPLPDAATWRVIDDRAERVRVGLTAVYAYYERNETLLACVLRDVEHYAPVQEVMALRYAPGIVAWHEVLGAGLKAKQRAMVTLALSFHTWRSLVRESGLSKNDAVKAMVGAIGAG